MRGDTINRRWSLDEAIALAGRLPRGRTVETCASRKDGDWSGGSFADALRMARDGSAIDAAALRTVGAKARMRIAPVPVPVFGVTGSQVDMGRFMQGLPECMLTDEDDDAPTPVLRIAVERAVTSRTPVDDIRAVGASVLAAITALRTAGVPAEIWAVFSLGDLQLRGETWRGAVCVQRPGDAIDAHRLAYWIAHESTFRRIGFALMEHEPADIVDLYGFRMKRPGGRRGGYGYPREANRDYDGFDEIAPATAGEATEWLRDVLARRAGIDVEV